MRLAVWRHSPRAIAYRGGYHTDRGLLRERNEDSMLPPTTVPAGDDDVALLAAVADGVGGLADGDVASGAAIAALRDAFRPESPADVGSALLLAAVAAGTAVDEINSSRDDAARTGSTLVAAALCDGLAHLAHVGDSRAYLFRGLRLRALTRDHTVVADAVSTGAMSEQEAKTSPIRNVLTRGLGAENSDVDVSKPMRLRLGDRILLCSDGVHGVVPAAVIQHTLERDADPQCAAERLIQHAIDHGAPDNATAVVIAVGEATS
jgi:protein phosphatase